MTKKNEVAKKESTDLAVDTRPDFLKGGSGRGSEEVSTSDITLPRIGLIQDLSPQHKQSKPEYIEGAQIGHMFNTITNELFSGPIQFIPVYFRKEYIIWKTRKQGGGFFGAFDSEQEAVRALPELEGNANDYEVVDTHVHYILVLKEGSTKEKPILEEVVLSLSKSQNKVSRQLNTMVKLAGGDRFSRIYTLSTTEEQNKNGDDYWNYRVSPAGYVSEPMYRKAEETYEAISSGERKVDYSDEASGTATKSESPNVDKDFDDEFAE